MTIKRIELANGKVSYLPYSVDDVFKDRVDKLTRPIADIDITYGTEILSHDDPGPVPGICVDPPYIIIVDPTRGHDPETRLTLTIAVAAHERGHVAFTPSSWEEDVCLWQNKLAPRLAPRYRPWLDKLANWLEDQRIERLVLQLKPELKPYFRKYWEYASDLADRNFGRHGYVVPYEYSVLSICIAIHLDYFNRMLNYYNWYNSDRWKQMDRKVVDTIKRNRQLIEDVLKSNRPEEVPALAYRIIDDAANNK